MVQRLLVVRVLQATLLLLIGFTVLHLGLSSHSNGHFDKLLDKFPPLKFDLQKSNPFEREQNLLAQVHHMDPKLTSHDYKYSDEFGGHKWYTESTLRALTACAVRGDCHPNAFKVAIFSAIHCHFAVFDNYHGGEGTWCLGMIDSLRRQGYTVLLAKNDWRYVYQIYRQIPDMVKVIIGNPYNGDHSVHYTNFIKRPQLPDGFPAWKFFMFYYFPNHWSTIVGNNWTIGAEPIGNVQTYLGYALEPSISVGAIPFDERPHRVYVLTKSSAYFHTLPPGAVIAWDNSFYGRVVRELRERWPDFEIVGAMTMAKVNATSDEVWPVPEGIRNLGVLNATEFDNVLGSARLLLGIGRPTMSPSPYRALARGVPFLNPLWGNTAQHPTMMVKVEEPFVYNVKMDDYEAFKAAIIKAMETPIEPWIAPWMTEEALDKRMDDFMNHDWKEHARLILEERKRGNETQSMIKGEAGLPGIFEL